MLCGRFLIFILIAFSLALAGCTRPEPEQSDIQISLPLKKSAKTSNKLFSSLSATATLHHVVVNISANGALLKASTWSSHNPTDFCIPGGLGTATCSLKDVPTGPSRLVQVVAVYKDSGSMSFYYGETTQTLTGPTDPVFVKMNSLVSGGVVSGNIHGRYLNADGTGPTGKIDIVYKPAQGFPVVIEQSSIVSGWFNLFGLAGLPLGYRLEDGSYLFNKESLDLNDSVFTPATNILKVAIPAHYRGETWNTPVTWELDDPNIHIYGYFGPGATGKYVCRPSTLTSLTKIAKASDPTGSALLTGSTSTIPAATSLLDTSASALSSYYVNGGHSSTPCPSFTESQRYTDYLGFTVDLIDGNGNDGAAGMTVPLAWNFSLSSASAFSVDTSSDPRILGGKLLPGTESEITSFQIYERNNVGDDYYLDNPDCSTITSATGGGYTYAGSGTVNPTTREFSITTSITSAEATAKTAAVLCPVKGSTMGSRGIFVSPHYFMSNDTGGVDHLAITGEGILPENRILVSNCTKFTVYPYTSSGGSVTLSTGESIEVLIKDSANALVPIYASVADCDSSTNPIDQTTAPLIVDDSFGYADFYYQVSGTPGTIQTLRLAYGTITGGMTLNLPAGTGEGSPPSGDYNLTLRAADSSYFYSSFSLPYYNSYAPNGCYALAVRMMGYDGIVYYDSGALPVSQTSLTGLSFYASEADCLAGTPQVTSVNFTSADRAYVYFRAPATDAWGAISADPFTTTANVTPVDGNKFETGIDASVGAANNIHVLDKSGNFYFGGNSIYIDMSTCYPLIVNMHDSSGFAQSTATTDRTVTFSLLNPAGGLEVYTEPTCTSGDLSQSGTITWKAGVGTQVIWVRQGASLTNTLYIDVDGVTFQAFDIITL